MMRLFSKKNITRVLLMAVLVYLGLGVVLTFFQSRYIYFPHHTYHPQFEECPFFTEDETVSHKNARFYYREGNEHLVVFYHGNGGSACDRFALKDIFAKDGASILFVEYPGYAGDQQKPSEEGFYETAEDVADFVGSQERISRVTIVGESLGAAAAAWHAKHTQPDRLILLSPFTSLPDVARHHYPVYPAHLLLKERYPNVEHLTDYGGEVVVIHGTSDRIVPHEIGQQLFNHIPSEQKLFIPIDNFGHNDLTEGEDFAPIMGEALDVRNTILGEEEIAVD